MQGSVHTSATAPISDHLHQAVDRFLTPRPSTATPRDLELIQQGTPITLDCGLAATAWGTGPKVLLAHGWESRRSHWGAFVNALVSEGFQPIAIDAPAHGDSPGIHANIHDYSLKIVAVGRQLGQFAGIIGHSFGAGASTLALLRGFTADRAVLISSPCSIGDFIATWARKQDFPEPEVDQFLQLVAERVGTSVESLELIRAAKQLSHPVLVIHDRGDDDVPLAAGQAMADAWPGSRMMITDRFGHKRILIAKEVIKEVVQFLKA